MTKEEMRIAIAGSVGTLGAFYCPTHRETIAEHNRHEEAGKWICNGCGGELHHDSPNYPEDLSAIIPILPEATYIEKRAWGWKVYNGKIVCRGKELAPTACEFYLREKGLWTE